MVFPNCYGFFCSIFAIKCSSHTFFPQENLIEWEILEFWGYHGSMMEVACECIVITS
jgi:hypothetical protein